MQVIIFFKSIEHVHFKFFYIILLFLRLHVDKLKFRNCLFHNIRHVFPPFALGIYTIVYPFFCIYFIIFLNSGAVSIIHCVRPSVANAWHWIAFLSVCLHLSFYIQYVQEVVTHLQSNLLYKTGNYFLETQYMDFFAKNIIKIV